MCSSRPIMEQERGGGMRRLRVRPGALVHAPHPGCGQDPGTRAAVRSRYHSPCSGSALASSKSKGLGGARRRVWNSNGFQDSLPWRLGAQFAIPQAKQVAELARGRKRMRPRHTRRSILSFFTLSLHLPNSIELMTWAFSWNTGEGAVGGRGYVRRARGAREALAPFTRPL